MSDYMGWTNKETWNVWIHIQSDYNTYVYYKECLDRFIDTGDNRNELIAQMEYVIERDHEDKIKRIEGIVLDLVTYSLLKVDWNSIASTMVDDAIKPSQRIKLKGFSK